MPTPTRPEDIAVFASEDFLDNRWDYRSGDHTTIIGSSGSGKTWLAFRLLKRAATPERKVLAMVLKPQDPTVDKFARELRYPVVKSYPPSRTRQWLLRREPAGYVVWPQPPDSYDPDEYEQELAQVFNGTYHHAYSHKIRRRSVPYIMFADETAELADLEEERHGPRGKKIIRVSRWINAVHARGRSLGVGQWSCTQRPVGLNLKAYQAQHIFLAQEPDARNRKRFEEIGGYDSGLIAATTRRLPKYHWLYLRERDHTMCIVGP